MTGPSTFHSRSGSWKWKVCALLLLASAINYMDRQTLAGASVRISREFALTQTRYGEIEAAFGYAFAAGSLVFGWMADRFEVRWVYATVLALWSVAGVMTGWASDHSQLLLCRAVLGFFEAGHWPCAVRTTRLILADRERSLGNGLLQGGATFGAIITPLMLPLMMGSDVGGWRPPFQWIGLAGLAWLLPWLMLVRRGDLPPTGNLHKNPAVSRTEFLRLVFSRRMLAILLIISCINTTWQVLRAWLPKFLQEGRGLSEGFALRFNSLWFLAADAGCLAAGCAAVWLVSGKRSPAKSRCLVFLFCGLFSATAILLPWMTNGPGLLAVLLLVAAGSLGVFPLYHTATQSLSGAHQGKITGVAGVAAWIIPAQAQHLFGVLADRTHSMDLGLALAGILPLLALVPFWFVENTRATPPSSPVSP